MNPTLLPPWPGPTLVYSSVTIRSLHRRHPSVPRRFPELAGLLLRLQDMALRLCSLTMVPVLAGLLLRHPMAAPSVTRTNPSSVVTNTVVTAPRVIARTDTFRGVNRGSPAAPIFSRSAASPDLVSYDASRASPAASGALASFGRDPPSVRLSPKAVRHCASVHCQTLPLSQGSTDVTEHMPLKS